MMRMIKISLRKNRVLLRRVKDIFFLFSSSDFDFLIIIVDWWEQPRRHAHRGTIEGSVDSRLYYKTGVSFSWSQKSPAIRSVARYDWSCKWTNTDWLSDWMTLFGKADIVHVRTTPLLKNEKNDDKSNSACVSVAHPLYCERLIKMHVHCGLKRQIRTEGSLQLNNSSH